jgi:hypothetical protein
MGFPQFLISPNYRQSGALAPPEQGQGMAPPGRAASHSQGNKQRNKKAPDDAGAFEKISSGELLIDSS